MKKTGGTNVRCLCPRCAAIYNNSKHYRVRRVKRDHIIKESCMICGKPASAVDYQISEKKLPAAPFPK